MPEETRPMNVYKVEVFIIDFDDVGEKGVKDVLENTRYPNRCLSPNVQKIETRKVDWHDGHPLNMNDQSEQALKDLFADTD